MSTEETLFLQAPQTNICSSDLSCSCLTIRAFSPSSKWHYSADLRAQNAVCSVVMAAFDPVFRCRWFFRLKPLPAFGFDLFWLRVFSCCSKFYRFYWPKPRLAFGFDLFWLQYFWLLLFQTFVGILHLGVPKIRQRLRHVGRPSIIFWLLLFQSCA